MITCDGKLIAEELVSKPPREEFSLDAKTLLAYYMLTQQVRPCCTVVRRTSYPSYVVRSHHRMVALTGACDFLL